MANQSRAKTWRRTMAQQNSFTFHLLMLTLMVLTGFLKEATSQCEPPYFSTGNECYYFSYPISRNYVQAQEYCEGIQGTLAILNTEEKQNEIAPYVMTYNNVYFWFGGYNFGHSNTYEYYWNGIGEPITWNNWYNPNDRNYEACAAISSVQNTLWVVGACNQQLPFICQKNNNTCYDSAEATTCSGSYTLINGKCYSFVTQRELKWLEAKEYCERRGDVLAILDSETVNDEVASVVKQNYNSNDFWIGTYDYSHEGTWVWDGKGTNITFNNWNKGHPNGGNNENCALMSKSTQAWEDEDCTKTSNFICQKLPESCGVTSIPDTCQQQANPTTVNPTTETPSTSCDLPFYNFGGGCFYLEPSSYSTFYSWFEAVEACKGLGATIAYIINAEEQNAVGALMTNQTYNHTGCGYWIGLNDFKETDVWVWEGTNQPANYTAWSSGYPTDYAPRHCTWMNAYCSESAKWMNGFDCTYKMRLFCRKEL